MIRSQCSFGPPPRAASRSWVRPSPSSVPSTSTSNTGRMARAAPRVIPPTDCHCMAVVETGAGFRNPALNLQLTSGVLLTTPPSRIITPRTLAMRIFFGVLLVLKERMRSQLVMSNLARMARGGFMDGFWFGFTLSGHWYM